MSKSNRFVVGAIPFMLAVLLPTIAAGNRVESFDRILFQGSPEDSTVLMSLLTPVLTELRMRAGDDSQLKQLLGRVRIVAPTASQHERSPNAWAFRQNGTLFVGFETRFARQMASQSAVGALLGTGWSEAASIFDSFCRDYQRLYRQSVNQPGSVAVYQLDFDKYIGRPPSVRRLLLDKLHAIVFHQAVVWFFLHEVGHHAKGHEPRQITNAESRLREAEADAWASETMHQLGYDLFGVSRYLYGFAATERCLAGLGLSGPETSSTHPSFATRFNNMNSQFDLLAVPSSGMRLFFVPVLTTQPTEMYVILGPKDYQAIVMQAGTQLQAISEWNDRGAVIYARNQDGGRSEFVIPDVTRIYNRLTWREFDAAGELTNRTEWTALQQSVDSQNFVQVGGGLTLGDLRKRDAATVHLRRTGATLQQIERTLAVIAKYESAIKGVITAFMKGQFGRAQLEGRITPIFTNHKRDFVAILGDARYAKYEASFRADPVLKWAPGGESNRGTLEEKLLHKTFHRYDQQPGSLSTQSRITNPPSAVPASPTTTPTSMSEGELVATALQRFKQRRLSEARSLLVKGAQAGYPSAQYNLGMLLQVLGERNEALRWLKESSRQGDLEATEALRSLQTAR